LAGIGQTLKKISQSPARPDFRQELSRTLKPAAAARKEAPRPGAPREEFSPVVPIILDVSPQFLENLAYEALNEELAALRRALYFDLGVPFPGINIRPNPGLPGLAYDLLLNEIPVARGQLEEGQVLVDESPENLQMLRLSPKEGRPFLPGRPSWWLPEAQKDILAKAGLSYMDHPKILAYHLSLVLARHAGGFLGLQETKFLLDKMEERTPDLVREATRLLPTQRLADIFQRLVSESVSVRDLRGILEAIIEWAPKEKDPIMLVEYVRGALKRQISYQHSGGQNLLPAVLLDPQLEESIRKSIRQTSTGAFLALAPEVSKKILAALSQALAASGRADRRPVVLASIDIRRYLRRLIEADFYETPVLSYQELTPEISVQPVGRVNI
ncbi:MAG: FHIPEP family type III secretion protein, partial [Candidatus Adiutrix sp.]|nr:FHIPEP family type III secretion protein [Candidatus Adiutrix sp.]